MHGTTKALIVAAAALQASANPVKLFERQVSSAPISTTASANATSSFVPTATSSEPEPTPLPTGASLPFPFPGSNGTYYICSFPSSPNDTATSSAPSVTRTSSVLSTVTASLPIVTNDVTSSALSSAPGVLPSITSAPTITSRPAPTPTEFTVVGPSTTAVIECIQVPYPYPPSGNVTTHFPGTSSFSVPSPTLSSASAST